MSCRTYCHWQLHTCEWSKKYTWPKTYWAKCFEERQLYRGDSSFTQIEVFWTFESATSMLLSRPIESGHTATPKHAFILVLSPQLVRALRSGVKLDYTRCSLQAASKIDLRTYRIEARIFVNMVELIKAEEDPRSPMFHCKVKDAIEKIGDKWASVTVSSEHSQMILFNSIFCKWLHHHAAWIAPIL